MVILETNYGDITVELDFDKAPKTAANFKQNTSSGPAQHCVIGNV